jgi:hypothetical protein
VRLIIPLLITLLWPFLGLAQYANDWIVPGQQYFRIPVAQPGVYRITHQDLQNAGVPVATIDPRLLQIFHRGKEQSIWVQGQADAVFNSEDYIEFFGQANDGTLDRGLYKPSTLQPHTFYNLFSDTTAYFLTWNLTAVPGKRIVFYDEVNVSNLPKESAHRQERRLVNVQQYSTGYFLEIDRAPVQHTHFDQGEGWTGIALRQGEFIDYTIDQIVSTVQAVGNPELEILLVGRDRIPHSAVIQAGPTSASLRTLGTQSFNDFETLKLNVPLSWSDIGADGKVVVRFSVPSSSTNRFQFSVSYLRLFFPQRFDATGLTEKSINLLPNANGKSYVEFTNAPAAARWWDVSDPANITAIVTRSAGTTQSAIVPSTQSGRTLFGFTSTRTAVLKKVSFRFFDPQQPDFIIISHHQLMNPAGGYPNPVKAYGGYRASTAGGKYDTLVMTMDVLYNQFNYGENSPLAIYEFMRYLVDKGEPKYLFLIGKGREVYSGFHRMQNPPASEMKDLVPSAGFPASDINFTAGLKSAGYAPAVPTGRLTATTPADVAAYLNKIKEYESASIGEAWQKKGLHLSGGIQPGELSLFRYYLDEFKNIGEGPYWGGTITTLAKREPSPVELINISDQVNAGVNLITFFGHSSSSNIDIDIGFVTDPVMGYNNPGKYPAFLINGCNAGSFFLNTTLFGENWMNAANRGARNVIAHSSFGLSSTLRIYSGLFYKVGLGDSVFVRKGIGDVQKEVARLYLASVPPNVINISQAQQMVLLGDPAVRLFPPSLPDYAIEQAEIVPVNGKPVTALSDTIAIKLSIRNNGLAKPIPLPVRIHRKLANGVVLTYDSVFQEVLSRVDWLFKIPRPSENGGGENTFQIRVDPENKISELREDNNEFFLNAFIATNSTLNLFPLPYSIVNQKQVSLKWQSTDLLSVTRDYQVEVDTSVNFNSPFLMKRKVTARVLGTTPVTLTDQDSVVYYWRTRFDAPSEDESKEWTVSSFSYIQNSGEGWAQLQRTQLRENIFSGIINEGGQPFRFEETSTTVSITTYGSLHPATNTDVSVKINNTEFNIATQGQPCRSNTLNLVAFHKSSAVPYAAIPFIFQDPRTCGREPQIINSFRPNELETGLNDDLAAAIDRIAISDSVVLFSIGDAAYATWSANVVNKLGELGISAAQLTGLRAGEPVIVFAKKGATPGRARMLRTTQTPADEQTLFASGKITGRKTEGFMRYTLIGPAFSWQQLRIKPPAKEPVDSIAFIIHAIATDGSEVLITDQATDGFDLSNIPASDFPFLKLTFFTRDVINQTPAVWKNWVVLYQPVAEGLMLYNGEALTYTVQEGQPWRASFGFVNISDKNFSSHPEVEWELWNRSSRLRTTGKFNITAPAPGDTTLFDVSSSTIGKTGANDLTVSVKRKAMPEYYEENNFMNLPEHLVVLRDQTPPVLEVTFDGRIIANGDFVSPTPMIQIKLRDENPFYFKSDLAGVKLLLKYPCGQPDCTFTEIDLTGSGVKWYPATATSDFRIDFTPQLPEGAYTLEAEAADASGNKSGPQRYRITFQVKAIPEIIFKGVYPNPSAIGFIFSFQLSGGEAPEDFSLAIVSLTGQPVCQFSGEDVKRFYIGSNELIWDGADAAGKRLGPGVYIYRLKIKTGGREYLSTGKLFQL